MSFYYGIYRTLLAIRTIHTVENKAILAVFSISVKLLARKFV